MPVDAPVVTARLICRQLSLKLECPCGNVFFYEDAHIPSDLVEIWCPKCQGPHYRIAIEAAHNCADEVAKQMSRERRLGRF